MNPDPSLDAFVSLSAVLTGFPKEEIGDPIDPDQLASTYYTTVNSVDTDTTARLAALLATYVHVRADSGGDPARELELVRARIWDSAAHGALARQIVCLWYLGRWNGGPYVSDVSYIRALAWQAMDTKAVGYSEFIDQYWTRPPASATPAT